MSRTLYFERDWNLIRDVYAYAQKLVAQHGWNAIQAHLRTKADSRGRVHFNGKVEGKVFTALITAMVEAHFPKMRDPYCWQELLNDPGAAGWINFHTQLVGSVDKNAGLIGLQQAWQERCHRRAGLNVYEPSLGLSEKLRATQLSGLTTDDLKLPYESVFILAPHGLGLKVYDRAGPLNGRDTGEWCELEAVYITEGMDHAKGMRSWTMMCIGSAVDGKPFSESLLFMNLDLPPGASLEKALQDNREKMMKKFGIDGPGYDKVYAKLESAWWDTFHWAMNLVLYLTLPDADVITESASKDWRDLKARIDRLPAGGKRDDLKARLKTISPDRRIYVGRSVRYDGAVPEGGPARSASTRATRVAGHWRNQAHGPRHTLRRLQWIEPFWRNLDFGNPTGGKTTRVVL